MKILIATGIYPPDIGGPAQIARGVEQAWIQAGHSARVLAFRFERKLPSGIRHLYYFLRVLFSIRGVDFVFSPDTFSAALPALFAAKLSRKKFIVRTGGDFLWEWYVERTGDLVLLRDFYTTRLHRLNVKERVEFHLVRFLLRHADAVVFSTEWQREVFKGPYDLFLERCFVVENYYGSKQESVKPTKKIFIGGVRDLKWKNMPRLKAAFDIVQKKGLKVSLNWETGSRGQFLLDIQSCYAVIIASLGDISPNTILEAITFNKPFILTRECGFYEKLKDIGVWVDPEDVSDIAAKIEWLCDDTNYEAQKKKVEGFTFTHSYEEIAAEVLRINASLTEGAIYSSPCEY